MIIQVIGKRMEPSHLTLNYIYVLIMQSYLFIALHILQTVQPENHEEPDTLFLIKHHARLPML